jgi:CxxC motif-containing protein (DUF1111 family)
MFSQTRKRQQVSRARLIIGLVIVFAFVFLPLSVVRGGSRGIGNLAIDPGPRAGNPGAGQWFPHLSRNQVNLFGEILGDFSEPNEVTAGEGGDPLRIGLGPRFDSNSCANCHAYPAPGGSSPPVNPLFGVYQLNGAKNTMPFFETPNGPIVVARFPYQSDLVTPDGHVHQLFVITGRNDAGSCNIAQPDFVSAAAQNNLILRQTTPTFGGGLVEIIKDADILANMNANLSLKQSLGITGHPNIISDDNSYGRFGWKAQVRSLMIFGGEAYNVEQGVTNELFPDEIDETPGCVLNPLPEDGTDFTAGIPVKKFPGDPERFALFSRFMAPPTPAPPTLSTQNGQTQFNNIGCVLCHTTSFTTPTSPVGPLSGITANLFSDLLVHHMGPCLADNVTQGTAQGDEFRTAMLWGVGQRFFFLHDGRTSNIVTAIEDHFCVGNSQYQDSEANGVVNNFNALSPTNQQDLINFLRSL